MFAILVFNYLLSSIGIPVFLHYCGGELESINYIVRGHTCCGGEELALADEEGCCNNEDIIIKNNFDSVLSSTNHFSLLKIVYKIFHAPIAYSTHILKHTFASYFTLIIEPPPPKLQHTLIISTSVLRV